MINLGEIVCNTCSGTLVKKDWYAECTNCGTKWIISFYPDGKFKSMQKVVGG